MSIKEVKIGFIGSFHSWLMSERKMRQNTTTKFLRFLHKIMNVAVMNGYVPYNSLSMYKVIREPVNPEYLTEEELQKIIEFDSPLERLVRTRDMFLFGCFTGLSYIDIKMLRSEHFETDSKGRRWIKKKREKTGVLSRIPTSQGGIRQKYVLFLCFVRVKSYNYVSFNTKAKVTHSSASLLDKVFIYHSILKLIAMYYNSRELSFSKKS